MRRHNPYISKPVGRHILVKKDGDTQDIINAILWADRQPEHLNSLKDLAPSLKGNNLETTLRNVWAWVKENIQYILDENGKQVIKSPAQTYWDGFSDCKGRSLFITSFLKNLGIPYSYRFASYTGSYPYKHVYVVVKANGRIYKLDPDMRAFNIEQKTTYFKDYDMSEISYIGSSMNPKKRFKKIKEGRLHLFKSIGEMTDFDMELAILKQRDEIQKQILERQAGVGCPHAEPIKQRIKTYNKIIELRKSNLPEAQQLAGIGQAIEQHFEEAQVGNIFKRAAKAVKKVANKVVTAAKTAGKAVIKVVTAPARLAAKGILEVMLPSSAPFFLYLFITNQDTINKLPEKARKKRKKSERIAHFIVDGIGMKQDHFMGILRNGIMKKYGESPEQVLSKMVKGPINGIGIAPALILAAIPVVKKIISTLMKVFGKKGEEISEEDAPDPNDFAEADHGTLNDISQDIRSTENYNTGVAPPVVNTRKSGIC